MVKFAEDVVPPIFTLKTAMSIEFSFDAEQHLYLVQQRPVPGVTQVLHSAGLGPTNPWFLRNKRQAAPADAG
jgi:hypothetical protein